MNYYTDVFELGPEHLCGSRGPPGGAVEPARHRLCVFEAIEEICRWERRRVNGI